MKDLLYRFETHGSITDRLQLLADDPHLRAAMSEAALQRVTLLGGWTEYGRRIVEVLKRLVDGGDRTNAKQIVVEK